MLSRKKRRSPSKSIGSIGSNDDMPPPEIGLGSPDTATLSSYSNRSSMLLATFDQTNVLEVLHEDDGEDHKSRTSPEIVALQQAFTRFCSKSGPMKTNVIRVRLLPFLRSSSAPITTLPSALASRLNVFQQWWLRLLSDVSSASAADRSAYYEAISSLMARPEWLTAPVVYGKLLRDTVAHAVERVAIGSAVSLAMGAFLGKVLAHAFFYCPGVAEPLIYLLRPKQASLDRLVRASLSPASEPRLSSLRSVFPFHSQHLVGHCTVISTQPQTTIPEIYGAWSRRWDASTEVFASFFKHYYSLLSSLSLPESENWLHAHLASPGIFHFQAAVLDFLESQVAPSAPSMTAPPSPDIPAPYRGLESSGRSSMNARRISRVDRLRILTSMREILHNDEACLPFWRPFALQFDRIFQIIARGISVYNMNACVSLCDLVEEWVASLTLFHPRSVRQQTRHIHEAVDWLFWVHVCQRMFTSENCHTEVRALSFLFNIWGHLPGRETAAMPLLPYIPMPYEYDLAKTSQSSNDSWGDSAGATTNDSASTLTSTFSSSESLQQITRKPSPLPKFTREMFDALTAANADPTSSTAAAAAAGTAVNSEQTAPELLPSLLQRDLSDHSLSDFAPKPPPHSRTGSQQKNQLPPHQGPLSLLFCPRSMSLLGDVTLWMLSEPLWERYFCHWNPLVRSYYQRLLVFRIVSAGPSSDFIAQTDWASYHSAARSLIAIRLKDTYNRCLNNTSKFRYAQDMGAVAPLPGRTIQIVYNSSSQNSSAEDGHHRAYPFDIFDNVAYYGHGAQNGTDVLPPEEQQEQASRRLERRMSMSSMSSATPSFNEMSLADTSCGSDTGSNDTKSPGKPRKWQVFKRRRSEKQANKEESVSPMNLPPPAQLMDRRPTIQRSPYRFVLAHSKRQRAQAYEIVLPRLPFEPEPLGASGQAPQSMQSSTELAYANYGSRSLAEWNQTVRMFEDFSSRQIHLSPCLEDMVLPFLVAEIPC